MNEVKVRGPGKPRIWATDTDFKNDVIEYITLCETKFFQYPNLSGFCVWMDIHRGTFYDQQKHYPDTYKKVQEIFENSAINSKQASDVMKFFYMKNKFDYSDKTTVGFNGPVEVNMNLDALTVDELQVLKALTKKLEVE